MKSGTGVCFGTGSCPQQHWGHGREHPPLLLVDGLLPHGHVLRVLLQAVQRRLRFETDPVIMILGVSPGSVSVKIVQSMEGTLRFYNLLLGLFLQRILLLTARSSLLPSAI